MPEIHPTIPQQGQTPDEIMEGEPRNAFVIQLCLIGALVLAVIVMAIVNRFVG